MSRSGSAAEKTPVAESELSALFEDFAKSRKILLAVSGGPDSTALLVLASKWRELRGSGPDLVAATITKEDFQCHPTCPYFSILQDSEMMGAYSILTWCEGGKSPLLKTATCG